MKEATGSVIELGMILCNEGGSRETRYKSISVMVCLCGPASIAAQMSTMVAGFCNLQVKSTTLCRVERRGGGERVF